MLDDVTLNSAALTDNTFVDSTWRDVEMTDHRFAGASFRQSSFADVEFRESRPGSGPSSWTNCKLIAGFNRRAEPAGTDCGRWIAPEIS